MIAYQYDKNGFYVGEAVAYSGLLPSGAGWEAPPTTMQDGAPLPPWHKYRKTQQGIYELAQDHRGREGWLNGEPYTVTQWGPLPDGWTEEQPEQILTQEEIQVQFTGAIQQHLDAFARTHNYDGILSAATYATSTVPRFRAEGQYAVEARDATWAAAYALMAEVLTGHKPIPTLEELLASMPPLKWPDEEE